MRPFILTAFFCTLATLGFAQKSATAIVSISDPAVDSDVIRQIEDDWLKAQQTTDIAMIQRIMADDYQGVGSNGPAPGKAQLLKNLRPHEGQAPPYTVENSDMQIFLLGDTAVAIYTKTYTAKENGNVAHEDMTDIFVKDHGGWKLRFARSTLK